MPEQQQQAHTAPDFGTLVGYSIRAPEAGTAELELPLSQQHCNRLGTVHGGVLMTLLDTAGMWACAEGGKAPTCPTISISCHFLRGVRLNENASLRAHGEVARRTQRMNFCNVTVYAGTEIVATAQAVYAVPPPSRGTDAGSDATTS